MSKTIQAIYERGTLRPVHRLPLKEHERVTLIVELTPNLTERTRNIIHIHRRTAMALTESDRLSLLSS